MKTITYKFVEFIPDTLEENTLYITVEYGTAVHKCFCGCGTKVVTPLSPRDWKLIFDGETVSLYPSIGNWSLPCRSHYWIENNKVLWAEKWSKKKIKSNRKKDKLAKEKHDNSLFNTEKKETNEKRVRKNKIRFWGKKNQPKNEGKE